MKAPEPIAREIPTTLKAGFPPPTARWDAAALLADEDAEAEDMSGRGAIVGV